MASKLEIAQAQFALDLLRTASNDDDSCFLSPVSISVALAMTYAGAADNIKLQMRRVLFNDTCSDEEVHRSFADLLTKLNDAKTSYELTTANRMYAQERPAVLSNFVDILSKHYRNEVHAVDFKTQAGNVTKKINDCVSEMMK